MTTQQHCISWKVPGTREVVQSPGCVRPAPDWPLAGRWVCLSTSASCGPSRTPFTVPTSVHLFGVQTGRGAGSGLRPRHWCPAVAATWLGMQAARVHRQEVAESGEFALASNRCLQWRHDVDPQRRGAESARNAAELRPVTFLCACRSASTAPATLRLVPDVHHRLLQQPLGGPSDVPRLGRSLRALQGQGVPGDDSAHQGEPLMQQASFR